MRACVCLRNCVVYAGSEYPVYLLYTNSWQWAVFLALVYMYEEDVCCLFVQIHNLLESAH